VQQQRPPKEAESVNWVEAQLPSILPDQPVLVYLPGGVKVEVITIRQAVELLRELGAAC
jgi:hypothetical protein